MEMVNVVQCLSERDEMQDASHFVHLSFNSYACLIKGNEQQGAAFYLLPHTLQAA